MNNKITGMDIKIARIKRGIKSYLLAEMLGVNSVIMSQIENNRYKPSEELLNKIKLILDLTEDQVTGGSHFEEVK